MKKGDCIECGKPLFDQNDGNVEQLYKQLCDECFEEFITKKK
jgi:hypothetical protein